MSRSNILLPRLALVLMLLSAWSAAADELVPVRTAADTGPTAIAPVGPDESYKADGTDPLELYDLQWLEANAIPLNPEWKESQGPVGKNKLHAMDLTTGLADVFDEAALPPPGFLAPEDFSAGTKLPGSEDMPPIANFGTMTQIGSSSYTAYPFRTNCKLFITYVNDPVRPRRVFVGSGALIGASKVITAGHCVYARRTVARSSPTDGAGRIHNGRAGPQQLEPEWQRGGSARVDLFGLDEQPKLRL